MSLVAEITKGLGEKVENLHAKTSEQPLVHVYEWIRQNAKILLFGSMIKFVPEEKRSNAVKQIITRFVDCFEKTMFDNYSEYSEKIRSSVFHAETICKIVFCEVNKGGNAQEIIVDLCNLMKKLPIPTFLNKMLPTHPIYGTNENLATEKKMKREEREKEIKELFPKSDLRCPECKKSDDVRFTSFQRRSGDEPPDEFYYCTPCNKTFKHVI